jgi:membrane-bound lytic murein transglycosylase D
MKNIFSCIILTTIVFISTSNLQLLATSKDSVTIIKITDTASLPLKFRQELAAKYEMRRLQALNNPMDSSRFVKRKLNNITEPPVANANITVNKSVYGTYTDYIIDYVKNYNTNYGARLSHIQNSSRGYFRLIDNIMKRFSVPKEMKSLAVIESAMNCNAVSSVGAVGPWQFMEGTARMLGLRVDQVMDERRDMYKSTNAAARYLKLLYGMFHDWLLVIASYNCGPAPVMRAINTGSGRSFWDIKPKLPKETQNHVMAFIATTTFMDRFSNVLSMGEIPKGAKAPKADFSSLRNNSLSNADVDVDEKEDDKKIIFTAAELEQMAILKVKGSYNLNAISKILDEDIVRLRRWNPNFDAEIVNSTTPVHLRIPLTKVEKFIITKEQIIAESKRAIK